MTAWGRRNRGAALDVRTERFGSTVVLGLEGRLTVESDPRVLDRHAHRAAWGGATHLVLDLAGIRQLDCSGIGVLLHVYRLFSRRGGVVALAGVEPRQRRLLQMAGLCAVFPMFENRHRVWFRAGPYREPLVPRVSAVPAGYLSSSTWRSWAAAGGA
jgi:anti-sigma B factor antagonist